MLDKLVQPLNAEPWIVVVPLGIVTLVRLVQFWKADETIVVRLAGSVTF